MAALASAANPSSVLRSWSDAGTVALDPQPGFDVIELQRSRLSRQPASRFLVARIEDEVQPLEQESRPFNDVLPAPALVADDHRVVGQLLDEISQSLPARQELAAADSMLRWWRVDDAALMRRVENALAEAPVRTLGGPRSQLSAIVPLGGSGPSIRPVFRALKGVETFREETFLTLVSDYARIYELDAPLDTEQGRALAIERLGTLAAGYHAFLLVLPGGRGRILRFRQALDLAHIPAAPRNPTLRSLDLALLNAIVFRTVLGLRDCDRPTHPNVFALPGDLPALVSQVEAGTFQAGFALNPPPAWEIRAVIEASQRLPSRTLELDELPGGLLFASERT